jgi:2-dehydro-3-deoxyphosphogluconate aldolase/(4S)-4-hydroxy-2-oxoglutarate aldolase
MNKNEVIQQICQIGIIPSVRVSSIYEAEFAAEMLYSAGIPIAEITLTLPEAPAVIAKVASRHPDMILGAGTVLDAGTARRCIDAGARFITSPGFIPEVVAFANQAGTVVLAGALTPTEVIAAWKAGADFVKIFPAAIAGGAPYIRALRVPLPQIPLIVTGGVNQLTAFDYILAGASAIGVGRALLPTEALRQREHHRIHELALRFLTMVRQARSQRDAE